MVSIPPNFSAFNSPAGNYMFKVNNRNPRTSCETCSKLTIKILDSVVNFEKVNAGWDLFLHVK